MSRCATQAMVSAAPSAPAGLDAADPAPRVVPTEAVQRESALEAALRAVPTEAIQRVVPGEAELPATASRVALEAVATEARACTVCAPALPLGPRPVFRVSTTARLLIVGQAPGTRVHESGVPFDDPSGDRLRSWLGVDRETFYDVRRIAIVPMGLCYPGRQAGGGDAPPRRECAPLWHERLVALMPDIRLTLLVGGYAQAHAMGPGNMTERVRAFRSCLPLRFPLPHPSWRTVGWERRNPWFVAEVLPALRAAVTTALAGRA